MSGGPPAPSPFVRANRGALCATAALGPVLDVACGRGRHLLACADWGLDGVGLDRDAAALDALRRAGAGRAGRVLGVRCDLETPLEMPVREGSCGAILVFRFLFRPLAPAIEAALAPGGCLLYETFTTAQLDLEGGPRTRAFLLEPGELPALFPHLEIEHHEEGVFGGDRPVALARLRARRRPAGPPVDR